MQRVLIIAFCLICAQIVSSLEDGFFDFHLMRYVPYSSKRSLFVENSHGERTNEWVLQLKEGTDPKDVARQIGLEYIDRVGDLSNMYLFRIPSNQIALNEQLILFHDKVELAERQFKVMPHKTVGYSSEPLWSNEWHLQNTGQNGGTVGADSKVQPVWLRNNMGQNSQIAIVDDGYETTHPDLAPGYVAADSYDFVDNDPDPNPALNTDGHGTCCAGVVGARDEGSCGVGAAFRARLAGIRLISSPVQYSTIASAVTYKNQNNWIYSNSWTFTACSNSTNCDLVTLPSVIQNAFNSGVTNGRGGKGSIFIYAAGNARTSKSSMNYQAMQRSIYVIAVSAVTNYNAIAYYSEPGSGVHVAAPSNGGSISIYTSDRSGSFGYSSGSCTSSFGGTSSACPLVAGIVGLMLTANPNLTWRDVQYILAKTATKANPNDPGWQKNGAGFNVSHDFGFGVVNADAAVSMAETYTSYLTCVNQYQSPASTVNLPIPDNNPTGITSKMTISGVTVPSYVEHTLIGVTISHPNRGQLRIILKSPSGTQSILASPRGDPHADYAWVFKSNFNWGESPNGEWSLIVSDEVGGVTGTLIQWQLSFSGPCSSPEFRELENANLTVTPQTTSLLPKTSVATTGTVTKSSPTISTTISIPTIMATTESTSSIDETTQEMITSLPITNSQPSISKETSDQILLPTNSDAFSEKSSSSRFGILGNSFFSIGWILVYVAAALLLTIISLIIFFVIRRTTRPKFAESWYI